MMWSEDENIVDSKTRVVKLSSSNSQNNSNKKYIETSSEDS